MKKIIRLTERDLTRIVKQVIMEQQTIGLAGTKGGSVKDVITSLSRGEINPKIGDIYKFTTEMGSHIRFKITSKENKMYNGTLLGVYGKDFAEALEGFRAPKVGDPIKLEFDNQPIGLMDEFTFYLPKTAGMDELGGSLSELKKLN